MTTFAGLDLPENILSAISEMGFETPTPIQAEAIPPLLEGRDVVGVAQTGTGKTAAFALPMLTHVAAELNQVQALVLAPTRELAVQVADAIDEFASQTTGLRVVAVYGGAPYGPQIGKIRDGAQVVVGTPGRLMDLIDRGAVDLAGVRYFVLDEADEMLRMGFAEDVEKIASGLPDERTSALFSATMPRQIRDVARNHMDDPVEITVTPPASTIATITQTYAVVPSRHKVGALARILATTTADAALVFVRTRATAEELAIELSTRGVQAATLSGDVQQRDREKLVERLRGGTLDVLVATDVAARGLDVERIGLVVNYDVPREPETYVHRIGRTGRAGREGTSLTFVTPKERSRLRRIERITGAELTEVELPTPAEVSGLRARRLVAEAKERFAAGRLSVYREVIEEFRTEQLQAQEAMSPEDLIAALLALGVRDPGPVADEEPERLTVSFDEPARRGGKRGSRGQTFAGEGTLYRVEVGRRDGVSPGAIVGAITGEGGLAGSQLGRIDIYPTFSLVEIDREIDAGTQKRISRARVSGRNLNISRDTGPRGERRGRRHDRKFGNDRRPRRPSGRGKGSRRDRHR